MLSEARQRMDSFNPQAVSYTLRALAKLNIRHNDTLAQLTEVMYEQMEEFSISQLAVGIWALARLKQHLRSSFILRFSITSQAVMPRMRGQGGGKAAALMLLGLSQLYLLPNAQWLATFCKATQPLLPMLPPQASPLQHGCGSNGIRAQKILSVMLTVLSLCPILRLVHLHDWFQPRD